MGISRTDAYRIAAAIGCNAATVRRYPRVSPVVAVAIEATALKLGIELPERSPPSSPPAAPPAA